MSSPHVSFVIPAYNEAELIVSVIEAIHAAAASAEVAYEIVVADDASADETAGLAAAAGARVVTNHARQISRTRNHGAAAARGEVLVFVDADTWITPEVVAATLEAVRNGAVGGGCAIRFDGRIPLYARCALPLVVWSFRVVRLAAGCYVFATRAAFDEVGGFCEKVFASEEVVFSQAMKRVGRFVVLRESVLTSGRKVRVHSLRDLLALMAHAGFRGRRALEKREGLELWYEPVGRSEAEEKAT